MIRMAVTALIGATLIADTGPARAERSADAVARAVVSVAADVPADARTARTLGHRRSGNGVAIDDKGLVLTIGYLMLEANTVTLETHDGRTAPAEPLAYDHGTGLGLVRALAPLDVEPIALGRSADLGEGAYALVVPQGGVGVNAVRVVSRRTFTGYWEYVMEDAIFTAPFTPGFAGAPLVDSNGELVGIGSLAVAESAEPGTYMPGNMFVPVDPLKPILADLLENGRRDGPHNPWLGVFTDVSPGGVRVVGLAEGGPAATAGLRAGDVVTAVGGRAVDGQEDLYRRVWSLGEPGVEVPLTVRRGGETLDITVTAGDRYEWLKLGRSY